LSGTLRLAAIPGDGIGPEVVREALRVLDALVTGAAVTTFPWGADHFLATGERLFEKIYVRCSDVDSDGDRVLVGLFDSGGLYVYYRWVDRRGGYVGVASARKSE